MKASAQAVVLLFGIGLLTACGGSGGSTTPPPPPPLVPSIAVSLSPASINVPMDGSSVDVTAAITTSNTTAPVLLSASGSPSGVSMTIQQPANGSGHITFSVPSPAAARAAMSAVTVKASNTDTSGTAALTLSVVGTATLGATPTTKAPPFMSTSFQLAQWSYNWLHDRTAAAQPLEELAPQTVRIQLMGDVSPQTSETAWDFSKADEMIQPVLQLGNDAAERERINPQLQIAKAPAFMYDSQGNFRDPTYAEFAQYCAKLVQYYNKGGFTTNGTAYRSPSGIPIKWWGVYNEPNINNLTPQQYVTMYNAVAAAMLDADPAIKLVALELSDWGNEPQRMLPPLLAGVTQPIHAIGTHYYSTCNQHDVDQTLMNAIDGFVSHVQYFRTTLDQNSATVGVPVWVNENNVNADWSNNGVSACNPPQTYVEDARGSSAFFAAWRPFVYSRLSAAGMDGLWHWSFNGGKQYGELADDSSKQLSYWVDYYLSHLFSDQAATVVPVTLTGTESSRVEAFAVVRADGSHVVMLANREVASATDNNGSGVPKSFTIDLSAIGKYTSVKLIAIDKNTSLVSGPTEQVIAPASKVTLTFPGYGVQFVVVH